MAEQIAVGFGVHLQEIAQVALTVSDLARAKAFYGDTLGMKFLFDAGTMAFFQCGSVRVMLGLAEEPVTPAGTILYYKVADIQAVHSSLSDQAVTFLQPPHLVAKMPDHDLWMAFFKDPDGNILGLRARWRGLGSSQCVAACRSLQPESPMSQNRYMGHPHSVSGSDTAILTVA